MCLTDVVKRIASRIKGLPIESKSWTVNLGVIEGNNLDCLQSRM